MNKDVYKRIMLIGIKYLPALFALITACKILLLNVNSIENMSYIEPVHWLNLLLSAIGIGTTYCAGRCLGFCWKHRSLCRIAIYGMIFYIGVLIFAVPASAVSYVCYAYMIITIITVLLYGECK